MKVFRFLFCLLVFSSLAFCDDYEKFAPKEVPQEPGKILKEEKKYSDFIDTDRKILVKNLNSLILVNDPSVVNTIPVHDYEGVIVYGFEIDDEEKLKDELSSFINEPVTIHTFDKIRSVIIGFYKDHGLPIVGVAFPVGQDISSGRVQALIMIGKLGRVKVENQQWFSKIDLSDEIKTMPGDYIYSKQMLQDLEWLNQNPFQTVNILYEKGKEFSETDIVLKVKDRFPMRYYAGFEDTGQQFAGPNRWFVGINCGNMFGAGHQMNVQFISAEKTNKWWGFTGSYLAPLPWRNNLKLLGSYIKTRPSIDSVTDMIGRNYVFGLRYEYPWRYNISLKQMLTFGYDFKRTNNFLSYAQTLVYNKYIDISQFLIRGEWTLEDRLGSTVFGAQVYVSPGNMMKGNTDSRFDQERAGADSTYFYLLFNLDRLTRLPKNFSWSITSLFQVATAKLMPSEQFSIGGFLTVRGYQENEIIGDQGILIKNELRFPPIKFLLNAKKFKNQLQPLAFVDFGWADDIDKNIMSKNAAILASIGLGFRYNLNNIIDVRYDYGWQLKRPTGRFFEETYDSRHHFGVLVAF